MHAEKLRRKKGQLELDETSLQVTSIQASKDFSHLTPMCQHVFADPNNLLNVIINQIPYIQPEHLSISIQ